MARLGQDGAGEGDEVTLCTKAYTYFGEGIDVDVPSRSHLDVAPSVEIDGMVQVVFAVV
jgi:hypothetical protein